MGTLCNLDLTSGLIRVIDPSCPEILSSAATAQTPSSRCPALWMLSDAHSIINLFGTVHFMRPDTGWWTAEVAAALAVEIARGATLSRQTGLRSLRAAVVTIRYGWLAEMSRTSPTESLFEQMRGKKLHRKGLSCLLPLGVEPHCEQAESRDR